MPDYSEAALVPSLGMYAEPYATVWPDLSAQLAQLYTDQTSNMPWLPAGWLDQVLALHGQNGNILVPAPAIYMGKALPFLQTQDAIDFWNTFNQRAASVISQYAADQQAQGAAELQQLYDDAAFWNEGFGASMIAAQQNLRAAGGAIADGAKALTTPIGMTTVLAGLGLVAFLVLRKR